MMFTRTGKVFEQMEKPCSSSNQSNRYAGINIEGAQELPLVRSSQVTNRLDWGTRASLRVSLTRRMGATGQRSDRQHSAGRLDSIDCT